MESSRQDLSNQVFFFYCVGQVKSSNVGAFALASSRRRDARKVEHRR